jgi:hypothetical protein
MWGGGGELIAAVPLLGCGPLGPGRFGDISRSPRLSWEPEAGTLGTTPWLYRLVASSSKAS